jgi:peroxiredoxin
MSTTKFQPGDVVSPRDLTTITGDRVALPAPGGLTHLQFRRFAGCPICNVHLRSVARRYDEIRAAGITEIAVFHSPAAKLLPHQGTLPFAVVADPARKLYAEFGVEVSLKSVLHPRAFGAPLNPETWSVVLAGFRNGASPFPGGETALGLPADLLIEPDGRVRAALYGRHASDHWPVDRLLELARKPDRSVRP